MSREILFKGKRKDWRELPKEYWWVEGNYITDEKDKSKAYIGYLFGVEDGVVEDCDITEIDPETLCQYTGVNDGTRWEQLSGTEQRKFLVEWNIKKDRQNRKEDWNGRKIWENDIVDTYEADSKETLRNVVKFDSGCFKVYKEHYLPMNLDNYEKEEFKIVGNIFDNPELLKED